MTAASSVIGAPRRPHPLAAARPSSFRPRPRQAPPRPPPPPVLPPPSFLPGRRGLRERKRLSSSSVSAAAAAAARGEKSDEEGGGKERVDPAFPLRSLNPRVLELIRARTGGSENGPFPPPPAASAVFPVVNEAACSRVGVAPTDAEALFGSLLPAAALGLRGRALVEPLRAAGHLLGGGGNGCGVLWSTTVELVDSETGEVATAALRDVIFGGNIDEVGDDERASGGNGLRLQAYLNAGYAPFDFTTGWSRLLYRLGARSVGCRVRIERYGGAGGGDGGEGGGGGGGDETDPLPPLFLVTAETAAGEPTERTREAPMPEPLPPLAERSEGLRAAVAEKLGGREPVVVAASFHKTIVTNGHLKQLKLRASEVAAIFWPLLPPEASDLLGRELMEALRADEERRRAEGTSTSKGSKTVWSTGFDLIVVGSGGGAKREDGDKEAEQAPDSGGGGAKKKDGNKEVEQAPSGEAEGASSAPFPAPTIVQVQLTAAPQPGESTVQFRISAGWPEALRAAGAFERGSHVVFERLDESEAAAASLSSSGGGRGRCVFVVTAAGKVPLVKD